jgi:hypothetical protein
MIVAIDIPAGFSLTGQQTGYFAQIHSAVHFCMSRSLCDVIRHPFPFRAAAAIDFFVPHSVPVCFVAPILHDIFVIAVIVHLLIAMIVFDSSVIAAATNQSPVQCPQANK